MEETLQERIARRLTPLDEVALKAVLTAWLHGEDTTLATLDALLLAVLNERLDTLCNESSDEARRNGLTEEELQKILAEHEASMVQA